MHLVAEHQRIFAARFEHKVLQRHRAPALFEHTHLHAASAQLGQCIGRGGKMSPRHRLLGAEGRLVHLGRGRDGGDAAEQHLAQAKGIGRAEHTAHIVHTPHIVQHHAERELAGRTEIGQAETTHFVYFQFFIHAAKVSLSDQFRRLPHLWINP